MFNGRTIVQYLRILTIVLASLAVSGFTQAQDPTDAPEIKVDTRVDLPKGSPGNYFNMLAVTGHVTEEHLPIIDWAKSVGHDGVEVPVMTGDKAHFEWLKGELAKRRMGARAIAFLTPDTDNGSNDAAVRENGRDTLWAFSMRQHALGAPVLVGPNAHALFVLVTEGEDPAKIRTDREPKIIETLKAWGDHQWSLGQVTGLEATQRFETADRNTSFRMWELVKKVDHHAICLMVDSAHSIVGGGIGEEQQAIVEAHKAEKLVHVHFSPPERRYWSARKSFLPAGLPYFCAALKHVGYGKAPLVIKHGGKEVTFMPVSSNEYFNNEAGLRHLLQLRGPTWSLDETKRQGNIARSVIRDAWLGKRPPLLMLK